MTETAVADAHAEAEHHVHHPSDLDYVKIAIGLAVLTAIEVAFSYIKGLHGLGLLIPLFVVMAIKFVVVAAQFMHLKFDDKLLTRVFYAGLVLACAVYLAVLVTMHVFEKGDCPDGHRAPTAAACTTSPS